MTEETIKQILKFRDDRDGSNFIILKIWQSPFPWRQQNFLKYSSGAVQMFPMRENRKKSKKNSQMC